MKNLKTLLISFLLIFFLTSSCSHLRKPTISNNIEISGQQSVIEQYKRNEYRLLKNSTGEVSIVQTFFLWFPIGKQLADDELREKAYFEAVDSLENCDAMVMPRIKIRRVFIPLLLLNFVIKKAEIKGRCIKLLKNEELDDQLIGKQDDR